MYIWRGFRPVPCWFDKCCHYNSCHQGHFDHDDYVYLQADYEHNGMMKPGAMSGATVKVVWLRGYHVSWAIEYVCQGTALSVPSSLKRYIQYIHSYILCHFPYVRKICGCGTSACSAWIVCGFSGACLQLPEMVHYGIRQKIVSFPCHVPYNITTYEDPRIGVKTFGLMTNSTV